MIWEIRYEQVDMPEGFVSKAIKYAHTEKEALKLFAPKRPDKNGWTQTKRKAHVRIISINEVHS